MSAMELSPVVWRKSSRSEGNGGNCVEVARLGTKIAVRDSKNPGPKLIISADTWRDFNQAIHVGDLDHHL
jgi:Domain of unknown function (DUF397)